MFVVADASGTFNKQVADAALMRMAQAGAVITNWFAVACELQRDWRNDMEGLANLLANHLPGLQEPDHELHGQHQEVGRRRHGPHLHAEGLPQGGSRRRLTCASAAGLGSRSGRTPTSSSPTAGSPRSTSAPAATAVAIKGGRFVAVGDDKDVLHHRGDETQGDRPAEAHRHPRPERLPPAPDPGRAQLQPGAPLGRRAVAGRRPADAPGAGPAHAAAAVGPRRRRLDRVPVRRAADADPRRDQRRRPRHAGVRPAPLRPGVARTRRRCGPSATRRTRPTRPAAKSSGTSRATRPACSSPGPTPRSCTTPWPRGRSSPPEDQVNSTRHFMREMNRLGITSVHRRRRRLPELPRRLQGHQRPAPGGAS